MSNEEKNYLSCKEFLNLCGITKNTLVWYEKKGLLKPEMIKENGYHYYSREQYFDIDLIKTLKWADRSLDDCKQYIDNRNEERYLHMLLEQQKVLEQKLLSVSRRKSIVDGSIQDFLAMKFRYNENPRIISMQDTYLLVKDIEENSPRGYIKSLHDLFEIFHSCFAIYGAAPSMLNGTSVSYQDILDGNYTNPSKTFLKISSPIPHEACRTIKQGIYAICFHRGKNSDIAETYNKLVEFIENEGYEITGDSWESDYINYLVSADSTQFSKEIIIPVSKRHSK